MRWHCWKPLCTDAEVQLLAAYLENLMQLCLLNVHHPCSNAVRPCKVKQKPSLNIDTTHAREHSVNATTTATQDWACQLDQHCSVTADQTWVARAQRCIAWDQTLRSDMSICTLCYCFVCCAYMAQRVSVSKCFDNRLSSTVTADQDNMLKKSFVALQQTDQKSTASLAKTWQQAVTHSTTSWKICLRNNSLEFVQYVAHAQGLKYRQSDGLWNSIGQHLTLSALSCRSIDIDHH